MEITDRFKRIWKHKWGRRAIIVLAIVLLLSAPVRCDGPYKGRVVEEATGRPVEGAVAVATWSYSMPTPAGGHTRCLDAAETLTDDDGRFRLPGRWSALATVFVGGMQIHIYKVGYRRVECTWQYLKQAGDCYADKPVEFDGDRAVFPLRRVAKDRLGYEGEPPHISCGRKDGKPLIEYIRVRKEYRRMLGLKQ